MSDPLQTVAALRPGSHWCPLLLKIVKQEAMTVKFSFCPEFKLRVYVDDIELLPAGQKKRLVQLKIFFSNTSFGGHKGSAGLFSNGLRKRRNKHAGGVEWFFLGREKENLVRVNTGNVGYLGIDKETDFRQLGEKIKVRRGKWPQRIKIIEKSKVHHKQYMRKGTEKLQEMGLILARIWA